MYENDHANCAKHSSDCGDVDDIVDDDKPDVHGFALIWMSIVLSRD